MLRLFGFANFFKRLFVMNLKVISVELDTQKLPIDLIDGLDIFFDIGIVLVLSPGSSIISLVGILQFEKFSAVIVKVVFSLP